MYDCSCHDRYLSVLILTAYAVYINSGSRDLMQVYLNKIDIIISYLGCCRNYTNACNTKVAITSFYAWISLILRCKKSIQKPWITYSSGLDLRSEAILMCCNVILFCISFMLLWQKPSQMIFSSWHKLFYESVQYLVNTCNLLNLIWTTSKYFEKNLPILLHIILPRCFVFCSIISCH